MNPVLKITSKTDDANDRAHGGGSYAEMGGLVMQRCARSDSDGGEDAQGHIHRHRRRQRQIYT